MAYPVKKTIMLQLRILLLSLFLFGSFSAQSYTYRGTLTLKDWRPEKGENGPEIQSMIVKWMLTDQNDVPEEEFFMQWHLGNHFIFENEKFPASNFPDLKAINIITLVLQAEVFSADTLAGTLSFDMGVMPPHGGTWGEKVTYQLPWSQVFQGVNEEDAKKMFDDGIQLRNLRIEEIQFSGMPSVAKNVATMRMQDQYLEFINEGDQAIQKQQFEQATNSYQKALELRPNDAAAKLRLDRASFMLSLKQGDEAFEQKNYPEAQLAYQKAAEILPEEQGPKDRLQVTQQMMDLDNAMAEKIPQMEAELEAAIVQLESQRVTSLQQAAQAFSAENENCYLEWRENYACQINDKKQQKQTIKERVQQEVLGQLPQKMEDAALCLTPSCTPQPDTLDFDALSSAQMTKAAKRKASKYQEKGWDAFKTQAVKWFDMAIQKDSTNAEAIYLRATYSSNMLEKMRGVENALNYNPNLQEAQMLQENLRASFMGELHARMNEGDVDYFKKAVNEGLVNEMTLYQGRTLMDIAIDADQPAMVNELLQWTSQARSAEMSPQQQLLFRAAEKDKPQVAQLLLHKGAKADFEREDGETPLSLATRESSGKVVALLLKQDIAEQETAGSLSVAVENKNMALARSFLESGADIEAINRKGDNLLMTAISGEDLRMVDLLLEKKANVNNVNGQQETPLIYATYKRDAQLIQKLQEAGAKAELSLKALKNRDPEATKFLAENLFASAYDAANIEALKTCVKYHAQLPLTFHRSGPTYLTHSLRENQWEVTEALLSTGRFDVNAPIDGQSFLLAAVEKDAMSVVKQLVLNQYASLETTNESKETALHLATKAGNVEMVEFLIEKGHPLEVQDKLGNTPLHLALLNDHKKVSELFMDLNTNYKIANVRGQQPIHIATLKGEKNLVEQILQAGVSVDEWGESGMTALHYAAEQGHFSIAKFLLDAGADPLAKDYFERTPMSIAKKQKDKTMIKLFK